MSIVSGDEGRPGPERVRRAVRRLDAVESTFYGRADPAVYEAVVDLLVALFQPRVASDRDIDRLLDSCLANPTDFLEESLFLKVNPLRDEDSELDRLNRELNGEFAGSNAVHLELGTYTAFPDARVDAIVARDRLGDFIRLDMNVEFAPDVAASCTALPFENESLDIIRSNSLFEHVAYPHEILREAFRTLRPGGFIYTNVPFHFVGHRCPRDYLRYTDDFFEDVGADIGFARVVTDRDRTGGVFYALHQMSKGNRIREGVSARVREIAENVHSATSLWLALIQPIDEYFRGRGRNLWHGTRALAIKGGEYRGRSRERDRATPFVERNLDLLCCPVTGEDLVIDGERLRSVESGVEYPIVNGVPQIVTFEGRWSHARLLRTHEALEARARELTAENRRLREELETLRASRGSENGP